MITILVIEDSGEIRENTAELLELEGYEILEASNGKEGYEMALEHQPHAIICDVRMPGWDGYEVLNRLKKLEQTRQIPFIFCTASAQEDDVRKGTESEAYEYITKPFDEKKLLDTLRSVLE